MKTLNIAYVGFGKSTNRYHIPYVTTRKNFKICRIVTPHLGKRPDEQAALEAEGTIFSTNLEDIIEDRTLDLVIVVTPARSHFELIKRLLQAGKNVLCDKPLVESLTEVKELLQLAQEYHCFFMPFQNRRFDSDFLTVKKILEIGYLGELIDISVTMDHYRPNDFAKDGGHFDGAWYGHGVHLVDQMISLFGRPKDIQYDIRNTRGGKFEVDDYFSVNLLYPGLRANISATELAVVSHPKWLLYGSKGTFIKENIDRQEYDLKAGIMPSEENFGLDSPQDFGKLTYFNQNGDRIRKFVPTLSGDYGRIYDSIYESLVNGKDKLIRDDEILSVVAILEKAFK